MINIEQELALLRDDRCTVDITDQVMAQISSRPLLVAPANNRGWRYALIAAACLVGAVLCNGVLLMTRNYNESLIGSMVSEVYSDEYYASQNATEYADLGLVEMFIEEEQE